MSCHSLLSVVDRHLLLPFFFSQHATIFVSCALLFVRAATNFLVARIGCIQFSLTQKCCRMNGLKHVRTW